MASHSSLRGFLPAAHGFSQSRLPFAALKAAATTGASFVVVCPAGGRAEAVAAALQAATNGAGLVLSSRVVARAAKRSGGVEDGRTGEDPEEVFFFGAGDDRTANDDTNLFFVGARDNLTGGDEAMNGDNKAGDDGTANDDANFFFVGASDGLTGGEEDMKAKDVGAGDDFTGKVTNGDVFVFPGAGDLTSKDRKATEDAVVFGSGEMTMEELAIMFQKETAMLLKQVKLFPLGEDDDDIIPNLIASCDALGDQLRKIDSPEGRTTLHQSLIALHLSIVSYAGGVENLKAGSYLPDMWSGDRHRLPGKEKRAGTLMELLLYSMMMATAALAPFVTLPTEIDLRSFD